MSVQEKPRKKRGGTFSLEVKMPEAMILKVTDKPLTRDNLTEIIEMLKKKL